MPSHIRKGDDVIIRTGEYRGQPGTVVRVIPKKDRVVVRGAGIQGITKTLKPTRINPQGGKVTVDRSFHVSNVSPVVEGKGARVRFEIKKDGSKVRVAVAGGKTKELGEVRSSRAKKTTTNKTKTD